MSREVLVIGAGAIGLCAALSLLRGGARVTVVDRAAAGAGASGSTAALLEYQTDADRNPDLFRLAGLSRALFPDLEADVRAATGLDFGLETNGILNVAKTDDDAAFLRRKVEGYRAKGLRAEWLTRDEALARVPQLSDDFLGAALFLEDGQVSGERFLAAMVAAVRKAGGVVMEGTGDIAVSRPGGRLTARGGGLTWTPDLLVVAAGAWSGRVLEGLGFSLPVSPVKGQLAFYDAPAPDLAIPVYTRDRGYIASKHSFLVVGSTIEHTGFDASTDDAARMALGSRLRGLLNVRPDLQGLVAGLRPATPDLLPFIGFLPGADDVIVATGHYRNGILLAPVTGRLVADLASGRTPSTDLTAFRPGRFVRLVENEALSQPDPGAAR